MTERWAIITGAAGGLGVAVCRQLASQGLCLLLLDNQPGPLEAATERMRESGATVASMVGDATDPDLARAAVARTEALGRTDVLVNVAGGSGPRPVRTIEDMDGATWAQVLALNPFATDLRKKQPRNSYAHPKKTSNSTVTILFS